jgi:hypothetical protein
LSHADDDNDDDSDGCWRRRRRRRRPASHGFVLTRRGTTTVSSRPEASASLRRKHSSIDHLSHPRSVLTLITGRSRVTTPHFLESSLSKSSSFTRVSKRKKPGSSMLERWYIGLELRPTSTHNHSFCLRRPPPSPAQAHSLHRG